MTITISLLSLSVNLRPTLPFLKGVLGILDILCSSKLKKKSEICSWFPSYFIENDCLKHIFSLCLSLKEIKPWCF